MWFRVDDKLWGSPKWTSLKAGPRALWVTAGSYSMDQLTDGFIPTHVIPLLGGKDADAVALVKAELWEQDAGGFRFHDWSDWQPSRETVLTKREAEAARKAEWRAKRAAERAASGKSPATVPDVSQRDNSVSPEVVPLLSRSSRPDPPRPAPPLLPTEVQEGGVGGTTPAPKASRRKPERPLPDAWEPTDKHREYATEHRIDIDFQARRFRLHAEANDRRARNWDAAFRMWLEGAQAGPVGSGNRPPEPKSQWDRAPRIGGDPA